MSTQTVEHIPEWTLGWRMSRALAEVEGMTTEQMADELGVSRSTVSRWLNDKGPVRKAYLNQWALRCGVPVEWLRAGENRTPTSQYLTDSGLAHVA